MTESTKHLYIVRDERSTFYPDKALITTNYTLARQHILDKIRSWVEHENIIIADFCPVKFTVDVSCLDKFTQSQRLITLDNIYKLYQYVHEYPEVQDSTWRKLDAVVSREYQAHHETLHKIESARKEWFALTRTDVIDAIYLFTGTSASSMKYQSLPEINENTLLADLVDRLVERNPLKTVAAFRSAQNENEEKRRAKERKEASRIQRMDKRRKLI